MTYWHKDDLEWYVPKVRYPEWLDQHPELRDANIEREVKLRAYKVWQNQQGYAVCHVAGSVFYTAEYILIGGSTETPNWCWADWYGTHAVFQGDWEGIPDMPTPDWVISDAQVHAWAEHHIRLRQKEKQPE